MTDHSRKYSHVWDFSLFISLKKLFISLSTHQFIQDMAILFKFIGHSVSIPKLAMLDHQMMKKNFHRLRHVRLDSWTILSMKIFSHFSSVSSLLFSRKNNKRFFHSKFFKVRISRDKKRRQSLKISRFLQQQPQTTKHSTNPRVLNWLMLKSTAQNLQKQQSTQKVPWEISWLLLHWVYMQFLRVWQLDLKKTNMMSGFYLQVIQWFLESCFGLFVQFRSCCPILHFVNFV